MKENDTKVKKDGWIWFFGAGTAAVILTAALFQVDQYLTYDYTNYEIEKGQMLRELRTAQAQLPVREADFRKYGSYELSEKTLSENTVTEEAVDAEEHSETDASS